MRRYRCPFSWCDHHCLSAWGIKHHFKTHDTPWRRYITRQWSAQGRQSFDSARMPDTVRRAARRSFFTHVVGTTAADSSRGNSLSARSETTA